MKRPRVLPALGHLLERLGGARTPEHADCIIVPGAWVSDDGVASDVLVGRVENAVALVRRGVSRHLLFTGGSVGGRPIEADVALRLAEERGFDRTNAVLERESKNTFENLSNARTLMLARGWKTAVISTDAVHVPRCLWMAGAIGLSATAGPAINSPADPERRQTIAADEVKAITRWAARRALERVRAWPRSA